MEFPRNELEKPKHIPSPEELKLIFEEKIGLKEYQITRTCENGEGVYLIDVRVPAPDGYTEYTYTRQGRYPEGESSVTGIHAYFCDENGIPGGGGKVAEFINGEWTMNNDFVVL